jgi:hypothetical protein
VSGAISRLVVTVEPRYAGETLVDIVIRAKDRRLSTKITKYLITMRKAIFRGHWNLATWPFDSPLGIFAPFASVQLNPHPIFL